MLLVDKVASIQFCQVASFGGIHSCCEEIQNTLVQIIVATDDSNCTLMERPFHQSGFQFCDVDACIAHCPSGRDYSQKCMDQLTSYYTRTVKTLNCFVAMKMKKYKCDLRNCLWGSSLFLKKPQKNSRQIFLLYYLPNCRSQPFS